MNWSTSTAEPVLPKNVVKSLSEPKHVQVPHDPEWQTAAREQIVVAIKAAQELAKVVGNGCPVDVVINGRALAAHADGEIIDAYKNPVEHEADETITITVLARPERVPLKRTDQDQDEE